MYNEVVAFTGMIFMFVLFFVLHGMDYSKYNKDGSRYEYHQASWEIHQNVKRHKKQRVEPEANNEWSLGD